MTPLEKFRAPNAVRRMAEPFAVVDPRRTHGYCLNVVPYLEVCEFVKGLNAAADATIAEYEAEINRLSAQLNMERDRAAIAGGNLAEERDRLKRELGEARGRITSLENELALRPTAFAETCRKTELEHVIRQRDEAEKRATMLEQTLARERAQRDALEARMLDVMALAIDLKLPPAPGS